MDNTSDTAEHEERSDGADSPDREPKGESAGEEAKEQLVSEAQVHAPAEGERSSPDYMDTRDGDRRSSSSSSSSSDEEEEEVKAEKEEVKVEEEVKAEEVVEEKAEVEPEPAVEEVEVNGEAHGGSRRSSSSSSSSASHGDPGDDPPRTREEDNAEDGMLMAYTHHDTGTEQEETVDYTLKTLESVTLDESSAAPDDPNQPDVALFVKVRQKAHISGNTFTLQFAKRPLEDILCLYCWLLIMGTPTLHSTDLKPP